MSTPTNGRIRIALSITDLSDAEVASTIAGIQKVAPSSALMQNAAIAASYTALGKKATTLASAVATLAADHTQLKLDETARDNARTSVQGELEALRALVVSQAASPSDITGMGFTPMTPATQTRTVPPAPAVVLVRPEKAHGRARVTVQETGTARGHYVAESTPDPISPTSVWSPLPGNGKQRTVTGATGSKVWVRFAQVRYGLQSDWSTAVLVTLP
jgi:hypothetical protein